MSIRFALSLALLAALFSFPAAARARSDSISKARQVVLVLADGWDSRRAMMLLYERAPGGPWRQDGPAIPAVLGKNGLAWGRGLHGEPGEGPVKREGDERAPAGVFRLGPAFGSGDPGSLPLKLPYRRMTESFECVDDAASPRYNQVLDASAVAERDWTGSERMLRPDGLYRLGVEVGHNPLPAVPGGGSCIFLHVWRAPGEGTSGCTAMSFENMERVAAWLDPGKVPVLAQYPRSERRRFAARFGLP